MIADSAVTMISVGIVKDEGGVRGKRQEYM